MHECHAGLLYARGRIEVEDEFVAMVFAGQVVVDGDVGKVASRLGKLAAACGLAPAQLCDAMPSAYSFAPERTGQFMSLLERVAKTLSRVGQERLVLLRKLRHIAEISAL